MVKNKHIGPVLKWVGGKRQLLSVIDTFLPETIGSYYEPFVGGGAVLFHLQAQKAVINDYNEELINVYNVIKNDVDALLIDLKRHANDSEYFYDLRAKDRNGLYSKMTPVEKASRVIFLNKTCFNGLYRVNAAGEFNTPFGRYKNPNIVNETTLRAVSEYFKNQHVEIKQGDFEASLKDVEKGAFVYFDPPYDPVSISSNFTSYTDQGFGRKDQIRLKEVCDSLNEKGVNFMLSNSATDFIKDLYSDYRIEITKAKRSINSNKDKRGKVEEVLVMNYE